METLEIRSVGDLESAAREFLHRTEGERIVAFYAPMGAGKTTFTTALCKGLGVKDDAISSPTFSIVNEYRRNNGESVFHFDFYRISKLAEALDLGFYDYIDTGSLCLIEWPENIEELLPDDTLKVTITVNQDGSRTLSW
ncbi:MAG: tRNA (adenosine(37)-N6)-threonylcarbamoyltransferase complex ATPase subunit type 1 TsaE [Bacteroidales bacterium]|nr:tRNA (adenosine(37)-N6)-threonylcarbamoyltransferase complex ATPase subunit type 1 TsaE [Bacteroidales bacterium]